MTENFHKAHINFPNLNFLTVNLDKIPEILQKFEIKGLPTYYVYKNGEKQDEWTGADVDLLNNRCKEFSERPIEKI